MEEPSGRVYAEINLDNIIKNMETMAAGLPSGDRNNRRCKNHGYGHGAVPVAKSHRSLCLRICGGCCGRGNHTQKAQNHETGSYSGQYTERYFKELLDYDIRPALYEYSKAEKLSKTAIKEGKTAKIHIALDTGMSRIGFQPGGGQCTGGGADSHAAGNQDRRSIYPLFKSR